MFNILVFNKVRTELNPKKYRVAESNDSLTTQAVILRSQDLHSWQMPAGLLAVARAGAGVDNIPVETCSQKGIVVFNTPGANANAVKELVIWSIITASRPILPSIKWLKDLPRDDDFAAFKKQLEAGKKQFQGRELKNKTAFVIGLGAIGSLVAEALSNLGLKVTGYDPYLTAAKAINLPKNLVLADSLDSALSQADFITIHAVSTQETKEMIGGKQFVLMNQGVKIINLARAEIINQEGLKAALTSGKVGFYVSDFISKVFADNAPDNVIFLPHLGASTVESEENCRQMAISQLTEFLEEGNITNSVNFPNCKLEPSADYRLTVINRNIPGMIATMTDLLAKSGINIVAMINASKGDLGYNIFDLDKDPSDVIKLLTSCPGIILVRKI